MRWFNTYGLPQPVILRGWMITAALCRVTPFLLLLPGLLGSSCIYYLVVLVVGSCCSSYLCQACPSPWLPLHLLHCAYLFPFAPHYLLPTFPWFLPCCSSCSLFVTLLPAVIPHFRLLHYLFITFCIVTCTWYCCCLFVYSYLPLPPFCALYLTRFAVMLHAFTYFHNPLPYPSSSPISALFLFYNLHLHLAHLPLPPFMPLPLPPYPRPLFPPSHFLPPALVGGRKRGGSVFLLLFILVMIQPCWLLLLIYCSWLLLLPCCLRHLLLLRWCMPLLCNLIIIVLYHSQLLLLPLLLWTDITLGKLYYCYWKALLVLLLYCDWLLIVCLIIWLPYWTLIV